MGPESLYDLLESGAQTPVEQRIAHADGHATDEVGLGAFQRYASLWGFAQGEPRLLVDFGEVSADYCGSYILYDEPVTHSRVTYVPDDGAPTFDVVRRAAPCRY